MNLFNQNIDIKIIKMSNMSKNELISIIILNYNGREYIFDCIESVFKTLGCKFEVILIDNDSSDLSSDDCKEKFPELILIKNKKNLAMAGRNVGIDNANGDYIVFLDADTVVEPNWLEIMIESYKKHGDGLYQGKLLQKLNHKILESCGDFTNIFGFGFARGRGKPDVGEYNKFQTISFPVGGFTFSSTKIIKKIGYVDESDLFFLMLDDLDYGWRAWSMDIPCYYEPKSVIYHLGSPVLKWTPQKFFFLERNRWICLLSLYTTKTLVKIIPHLLLIEAGMFFYLISKGLGLTKIKAFFSILKMYSRIKKRKINIMKLKTVSDKKIIEHFVDNVEAPQTMTNYPSDFLNTSLETLSRLARKII